MILPLIIGDEAEADLQEALIWYAAQRDGLDDEFWLCVETAFDRIRRAPLARAEGLAGIRCRLTNRFPYGIYYTVEPEFIKILAVYHTRRDPRGWQTRK